MKTIFITVVMIAMVVAEPPPSKSYLPPPSGRTPGYPRGPQSSFSSVPEVISARTLGGNGQEVTGNGFTRSSIQDQSHARLGHDGDLTRDQSLGRNVDIDDDTVSFEADVSGFKAHASYHDAEGRSAYDPNLKGVHTGNLENGPSARANGVRSKGY